MAIAVGTVTFEVVLRPVGSDRETVIGTLSVPVRFEPGEG